MAHVHTMIKDPSSTRKEILSSELEAAEFLRSLQSLGYIHQKKLFYFSKISSSLRALKVLQSKLSSSLPPFPKEYGIEIKKEVDKQIKEVKKKESRPTDVLSEKHRLDSEIRELHRRISDLNI